MTNRLMRGQRRWRSFAGLAEIERWNRSRTGSCGNEPSGARPDGSFSLVSDTTARGSGACRPADRESHAQRQRAEADVGPVRYLAELIGTPATDLERPVRLLTLALVAVLDPLAVALLLAAGTDRRRASSR